MSIESLNPATGEKIKTYPEMTPDDINSAIEKTHQEFLRWRHTSFAERSSKMKKAAEILRQKKDEYAHLMTVEMGKPLAQGKGEAEKCAWVCDFYAENAQKFLSEEEIPSDASKSFVHFEPLGVVLADRKSTRLNSSH